MQAANSVPPAALLKQGRRSALGLQSEQPGRILRIIVSMSASEMPSFFIAAIAASTPSGCTMLLLWPRVGGDQNAARAKLLQRLSHHAWH